MKNENLSSEIVRIIEAGINKHLNRSFAYTPFRLFYNLIKKSRPQTINQVREIIGEEIGQRLESIENFNPALFMNQNKTTEAGKLFMKKCYNIGIRLLRDDLTVMLAFKVMRDSQMQEQIYEHILEQVQNAAEEIINPTVLNQEAEMIEGEKV